MALESVLRRRTNAGDGAHDPTPDIVTGGHDGEDRGCGAERERTGGEEKDKRRS